MGIMVVVMVALLVWAPGHMGFTGTHQHGQGTMASQPSDPQGGNSGRAEVAPVRDLAGHRD